MKPKEIIQYLEMVRPTENYSHTFPVSVGNARHFGPGSQLNKDVSTAIDLAIKSLEKQVPKKLERDGEFDLLCAGCWSVLDFKGYDGDYCPYCGQKIDWSESE